MRQMSEEGKAFIKRREACRLQPHFDAVAGVYDVGYGHRFKDGEPRVPITMDEANALFDIDIHYYSDQVDQAVLIDIPQPIFDALCSLTYNIGGTNFRNSTLLSFVNSGMLSDAAVEFLEWRKSQGVDVDGLLNRRAKEVVMFAKGLYLP